MKKLFVVILALSAPALAHAGFVCRAQSTMNVAWGEGEGFTLYQAQASAINYCLASGGYQCVIVGCEPAY